LSFDREVVLAVEGLEPFFNKILRRTLMENTLTIAEYTNTVKREINISNGYRKSNIHTLTNLSKFYSNRKSSRKWQEKIYFFIWIVSENLKPQILFTNGLTLIPRKEGLIVKFFKWLFHPDVESANRSYPKAVENIPKLKRKEQSIYKPTGCGPKKTIYYF
jgi:hypothetical protein